MTRGRQKIEYLIGPTEDGITHYTWTMIVTQGDGAWHRDYNAETWCGVKAPLGRTMRHDGFVTCLACTLLRVESPVGTLAYGFRLYDGTYSRSTP